MLSSEPIRAPEARPFHRRDAAADAVRRALDLLGRASDDWRNGGQLPVGPCTGLQQCGQPMHTAIGARGIGRAPAGGCHPAGELLRRPPPRGARLLFRRRRPRGL